MPRLHTFPQIYSASRARVQVRTLRGLVNSPGIEWGLEVKRRDRYSVDVCRDIIGSPCGKLNPLSKFFVEKIFLSSGTGKTGLKY